MDFTHAARTHLPATLQFLDGRSPKSWQIGGPENLVGEPRVFLRFKIRSLWRPRKERLPASRDLEDVIAVVDGRAELAGEIRAARNDVRLYLAQEIAKFCLS